MPLCCVHLHSGSRLAGVWIGHVLVRLGSGGSDGPQNPLPRSKKVPLPTPES